MTKKIAIRALAVPALALGLLAAPRPASAQVSFEGTFVGPHGAFSIGVGHPRYAVGSYVPHGYRVFHRPRYGYGFWSPAFACRSHHAHHAHWVPVKHYRQRWVVVERPIAYGPYSAHPLERAWGHDRYDRYDRYDRHDRYDDDDRRGYGHKKGKKHKHGKSGRYRD
jgi:hypothetical protein